MTDFQLLNWKIGTRKIWLISLWSISEPAKHPASQRPAATEPYRSKHIKSNTYRTIFQRRMTHASKNFNLRLKIQKPLENK